MRRDRFAHASGFSFRSIDILYGCRTISRRRDRLGGAFCSSEVTDVQIGAVRIGIVLLLDTETSERAVAESRRWRGMQEDPPFILDDGAEGVGAPHIRLFCLQIDEDRLPFLCRTVGGLVHEYGIPPFEGRIDALRVLHGRRLYWMVAEHPGLRRVGDTIVDTVKHMRCRDQRAEWVLSGVEHATRLRTGDPSCGEAALYHTTLAQLRKDAVTEELQQGIPVQESWRSETIGIVELSARSSIARVRTRIPLVG